MSASAGRPARPFTTLCAGAQINYPWRGDRPAPESRHTDITAPSDDLSSLPTINSFPSQPPILSKRAGGS
eukprot:6151094-Pyramimonas_sp.AAC.1